MCAAVPAVLLGARPDLGCCAVLQHYMQDKAPRGYVLLDRAKVEMEDGQLKLAGQTIIKLQTPDRTLVFRLDNKAKASEGADMFGDIEARCATGDVVSNAVTIQSRFRARQ